MPDVRTMQGQQIEATARMHPIRWLTGTPAGRTVALASVGAAVGYAVSTPENKLKGALIGAPVALGLAYLAASIIPVPGRY